jgi:hypothetical protein
MYYKYRQEKPPVKESFFVPFNFASVMASSANTLMKKKKIIFCAVDTLVCDARKTGF